MDEWERDRLERERTRREEERERREREKHQGDERAQMMATMEANERRRREAKRDRVESLRREGYSEGEIRSLERKRGCRSFFIGVAVLIVAVVAALFVLGSRLTSESSMTDESLNEVTVDPAIPDISESNQVEVDARPSEATAVTEEAAPPGPSPKQQIEFVSEPVVQPIPDGTVSEPEVAPNVEQ